MRLSLKVVALRLFIWKSSSTCISLNVTKSHKHWESRLKLIIDLQSLWGLSVWSDTLNYTVYKSLTSHFHTSSSSQKKQFYVNRKELHQLITREVRGLWDVIYLCCWTSTPKKQERSPFKVSLEVKRNSTCLTVKTDVWDSRHQRPAINLITFSHCSMFRWKSRIYWITHYFLTQIHIYTRSWKDKLEWVIVSIRSFSNQHRLVPTTEPLNTASYEYFHINPRKIHVIYITVNSLPCSIFVGA